MNTDWMRGIRDNCDPDDVSFFFKQWGGFNKKKAGRLLDGRTWEQIPTPIKSAQSTFNIASRI